MTDQKKNYLDQADEWLTDVLATKGAETSQEWSERVKGEIKKKLLESFRIPRPQHPKILRPGPGAGSKTRTF